MPRDWSPVFDHEGRFVFFERFSEEVSDSDHAAIFSGEWFSVFGDEWEERGSLFRTVRWVGLASRLNETPFTVNQRRRQVAGLLSA